MYLLVGLIGALIGARKAKKLNGSMADVLQYAAGFGVAFALIGLIATIIFHRTFL